MSSIRRTNPNAVLETFPTDTSRDSLKKAFGDIKAHNSFNSLKLVMAVYSIKHSSKKPFMEETYEEFTDSLETYVGGAFTFAQESLKRFFEDHGETPLSEGGSKKGVSIYPAHMPLLPSPPISPPTLPSQTDGHTLTSTLSRLSYSPAPSAPCAAARNSLPMVQAAHPCVS